MESTESSPPMSALQEGKLHIAMFPWLAFGHMIPYLELAKLIAQKGHRVSFISAPRNIDRLPRLPPNLAPLINLVKLPLPAVDHLPENAEATSDLPYDKVNCLKTAVDGLRQPLTNFLQASSPDWILIDFVPYWVCPIAARLNIRIAFFSIFIASFLAYMGPPSVMIGGHEDDRSKPEDFTVPPKWIPFESTLAYRLFEILRIFQALAVNDGNVSDSYRAGNVITGCDVVAVRSCRELEPEWLQLLEDLYQKPVIPVGQLPTTASDDGGDGDGDGDVWRGIKEWLDKQSKRSVVYVAFGSEAKPSQAELAEIALGLELSELPFYWVLRKQRGSTDTEVVELPDGFEERTRGRGVVCTSWVPQLKILSHDSVGGLLTHSGWTTVVEAIRSEKPLILLTFLADQGLNARLLEEKKMGYSIPRDNRDGSFTRNSVAESLRLVMTEDEGKIYRDRVREMSGLFGDKHKQDKYVDNFLSHLQTPGNPNRL